MKIFKLHPKVANARHALSCMLLLATPCSVVAQTAENFQKKIESSTAASEEEAGKKSEPAKVEVDPKLLALQSRHVSNEDLETYIESMASTFSMQSRELDPFGQSQDPNAPPVIKNQPLANNRPARVQAVPLVEMMKLLNITTIMPKDKKFLIGTRSIGIGDVVNMTFRGKTFSVQITDVSASSIVFKNTQTGETAARVMEFLPAGMSQGNQGVTAPGMVSENQNLPIELDSNASTTEPTASRQ